MTVTLAAPTKEQRAFALDLYRRLPGRMLYVAENWETELLQPLGYRRCDQSDVAHALRLLVRWGYASRASDSRAGGYHVSRRRDYPRPRRVIIVKVPRRVIWSRRLADRMHRAFNRPTPYRSRQAVIG